MKEFSVFHRRQLLILFSGFFFLPFLGLGADTLLPNFKQLQLKDPNSLQEQLIKSIIKDEQGFLWLLTDAGLLRYEQPNFHLFERPPHLVYPKSMLRTQAGIHWVIGDMGLMQMIPKTDTVEFILKAAGSSKGEPNKIHYGKNLFEDRDGRLWLGGIKDIYRYEDEKLYTYPLGGRFWSEDFDHGFAFAEDHLGRLWATSFTGQIGYYQAENDIWIWLPELGISQVVDLIYDDHNQCFWLGSDQGILQLNLDPDGMPYEQSWIQKSHPITCLSLNQDQLWWADKNGTVFMRSLRENTQIKAGAFPGQEISSIYAEDPRNIWIATDNGLGLIYPSLITAVASPQVEAQRYIESLITVGQTTYFCDRYRLYRQKNAGEIEVLLYDPSSYLLGLAHTQGQLLLFSRKGLRSWQKGNFQWVNYEVGDFFMPATDQEGRVWVCHMDRPGVSRMDTSQTRHNYLAADASELSFGVVRKSPAGTMYFGGAGTAHLLYRYDPKQDQLVNLLPPQPLPPEIKIQDISIEESGKVWLATNVGLFYWEEGNAEIQPYKIEGGDGFPSISAVHWQNDQQIWIAIGSELVLIDPSSQLQFHLNRWNGLPNGDISAHNLSVHDKRLLIGTHRGLFELDTDKIKRLASPKPIWRLPKLSSIEIVPKDTLLSLTLKDQFSFYPSMAAEPSKSVEFRYRVANKSQNWQYVSGDNLLHYIALKTGADQIELQAKRYGFYTWSESRILKLKVTVPWFLHPFAWVMAVLLIFMAMGLVLRIKSKLFKIKQANLKKVVDTQTAALKDALIRERSILSTLQQTETRYRLLFESARDGIMILKDDKVVDANEQAWRMFGYDRESFIGISLGKLYPKLQPDGRLSEEKALRQLARSRWDAYYEHWKQKRKDGSLFDAEISLNRMRIDSETYIQVIFRNITGRIEAKEEQAQQLLELNRKNKELKKYITSNAELENFAYVVSHDLRQPLRSISSFANILERRYRDQLDDEGKEFLDFVVRGAKSMNELILHLLDFSRITRTEEPKTWIPLPKLVSEVLELLQKQIFETQTELILNEIPNVSLFGHRTQLMRVVQNLLSNAIKFHKPNDIPQVEFTGFVYKKQLHLQIKDNGIGIAPDNFDRIFWLFQRLNPEDEFEGTGIGLSVCKKILEHHEGRIKVSSILDQGTTFEICLPHFSALEETPEPETINLPSSLSWLKEES